MYIAKPKVYILFAAFATTFALFLYNGWQWKTLNTPHQKLLGEELASSDMRSFATNIRNVFEPILVSPTAPYFVKEADRYHSIGEAIWSSLGSELCIADIDTRSFNKEGQLLSEDFSWSSADTLSAGMLNHFFYASVHGYSYHFIHTEPWPNDERDNVWTKVPQLRRLLDVCRIAVVVDSDVVFQHLELPFEWLLNRWNFTKKHSIAMPFDTSTWVNDEGVKLLDIPDTHDSTGLLSINGGVVIAQSSPRTKEMVDSWIACPDDDGRFPGCSKLAHGWPAEQGAYSEYIRHYFTEPEDTMSISCDDANGFPGQHMNCSGTFLRHYTSDKPAVKIDVGQILLESLTAVFVSHLDKSKHG